MKKNCLIIAGEKSGEEHCLTFFNELKKLQPNTHFWGVGGDEMINKNFEAIYHLKDFSTMGFTEVFKKIFFYIKAFYKIVAEVKNRNCKTAILIDFQGFNLRLAKKLSSLGVNVIYYVAPQAWVWKSERVHSIRKYTHTLFSILPFEKKWFQERGVKNVLSVPHPICNRFENKLSNLNTKLELDQTREINLLVLPGSRNSELKYLLNIYRETLIDLKSKFNIKATLVKTSSVNPLHYTELEKLCDETTMNEDIESALKKADIALAASGTVTLICGLFEVPTTVTYQGSLFNEFVFECLIKYKGFVSLTNIIHGKELFPEYFLNRATPYNLSKSVGEWILNKEKYRYTKEELRKTNEMLLQEDVNVSHYINNVINENE